MQVVLCTLVPSTPLHRPAGICLHPPWVTLTVAGAKNKVDLRALRLLLLLELVCEAEVLLDDRGEHPVVTGTLDTLTKKLDLPLRHTRWPWLPLRACRLLRRFEPADEAGCAALACYPRQHTRGRVFRAARPRRQRFCSISSAPNVDGEGQQVRSCPYCLRSEALRVEMLLPRTPLTNPVRRLLRRNRLVMLEHPVRDVAMKWPDFRRLL